jgi:hypothetical protein
MAFRWFGRPKPEEKKQEVVDYTSALRAPQQTRVPLRLRGLLLLKLQPTDGIGQIENAPPLGSREDVVEAIRAITPGMQFNEEGRGVLTGGDYRLILDLGRDHAVYGVVAEAEGDAGLEFLRSIVERQGWRIYAPKAGVFIEPNALDLFALPDDLASDRLL